MTLRALLSAVHGQVFIFNLKPNPPHSSSVIAVRCRVLPFALNTLLLLTWYDEAEALPHDGDPDSR